MMGGMEVEPHRVHARRVYEWHINHQDDPRAKPDWARAWLKKMVETGYITEAERLEITGEAIQMGLL